MTAGRDWLLDFVENEDLRIAVSNIQTIASVGTGNAVVTIKDEKKRFPK